MSPAVLFFLCAIVVVLALIAKALTNGGRKNRITLTQPASRYDEGVPANAYAAEASLLSPAERSFLGVLDAAGMAGVRIFPKVRIADIVHVRGGLGRSVATTAQNRINSKHVDFVCVREDTMAPVLIIELDDSSHARPDRMERDDFVDSVFASAGIPVLHVPNKRSYSIEEVRRMLMEFVDLTSPLVRPIEAPQAASAGDVPRLCPKCGSMLVQRTRRNGGETFLGCSAYPRCRHTE